MTPRFLQSIAFVLRHEGGLSGVAEDRGGLTKWGISTRSHPVASSDAFTFEHALEIYRAGYWVKMGLEPVVPWTVAAKTLDFGVVSGPSRGGKCLQKALNSFEVGISVDGKVGSKTRAAIEQVLRKVSTAELIDRMVMDQERFFRGIVNRDQTQRVFLRGWLRRAQDMPQDF